MLRSDIEAIKFAYRLGLRHSKWRITDLLKDEHVAAEVGTEYVRDFWRGVTDWRMTRDEDSSSSAA